MLFPSNLTISAKAKSGIDLHKSPEPFLLKAEKRFALFIDYYLKDCMEGGF
jgi:hypothetical protein